ncbi:excisionase family DNA binding protein [Clostridium saccharoperbutylacetonicum]|uniref:Excisionase family n=1 Tax=Clostridium saccharoperbutylacetonicum N1-4(HMT) TaxID=931276 RepID=M1LTQ9_9CLOT|nr:excisionase family DNA-binding protein [Clostridium saccharoperbutylacetonicum]AGF56420.1 excisionase family [Clostridium saccharoperbutylacetonicum N1-4(HMT)]NRT62836.1 excisionase family DNA binding protein [Clostridium saccharoperbutylacetonicum]NSB26191.1 excisionase family DNA binding protein [Clostridium saccharoperbutylacetonicum]NSB45544.1 excisionase family DNA binding protein [Clostridium saccharoperbutylacetonicum]
MEELLKQILERIKDNSRATMTVVECAQYIKVNKDKIRELINKPNSDFPYFKNGSKVIINKSQLDSWLDKISREHRNL